MGLGWASPVGWSQYRLRQRAGERDYGDPRHFLPISAESLFYHVTLIWQCPLPALGFATQALNQMVSEVSCSNRTLRCVFRLSNEGGKWVDAKPVFIWRAAICQTRKSKGNCKDDEGRTFFRNNNLITSHCWRRNVTKTLICSFRRNVPWETGN